MLCSTSLFFLYTIWFLFPVFIISNPREIHGNRLPILMDFPRSYFHTYGDHYIKNWWQRQKMVCITGIFFRMQLYFAHELTFRSLRILGKKDIMGNIKKSFFFFTKIIDNSFQKYGRTYFPFCSGGFTNFQWVPTAWATRSVDLDLLGHKTRNQRDIW